MKKKILSAVFAGLMALNLFGNVDNAQAASREEISKISVGRSANFKYWTADSKTKKFLVDYVKDVTDKRSKNFIPVEDRVAVFDMDGTLVCETAPSYIGWMFPITTVFENPTDNVNTEIRTRTQIWLEAIQNKNITDEVSKDRKKIIAEVFAGLTEKDYISRFKKFMDNDVEGLTNLKYGESFYLPMVEIVSYLNANDFSVYVVTGSERNLARTLIDGAINIKRDHIIGEDVPMNWKSNGGEKYFVKGDEISFKNKTMKSTTRINKIYCINREIGRQPVLAFGNSMGDADMLNYTLTNKYKSAAFVVLCDDYTREIGNKDLENTMRDAAKKNKWTIISMKNDFKTIYGDKVKLDL
ncbi:MAG: haloacid dehalogenase-like hydrolase [Selenomonadaceae bacterium]|nr:haloacid dehalogenase-like hydrolase [Selenomonadaceae bacterium]